MKYFDNYCEKVCKYKDRKEVTKTLFLYDQNNLIDNQIKLPFYPCDYCTTIEFADKVEEDIIWGLENKIEELQCEVNGLREQDFEYLRDRGLWQ